MNKPHLLTNICQKSALILTVFCFAFTALYTPQVYKVNQAHAAEATEPTQLLNLAELIGILGTNLSILAEGAATAFNTYSLFIKETVLDGLAWAFAKAILSELTASIVDWINSGFEGSPAFIQDLQGFMVDIADRTMGGVLEEIGGPFSFICSPFQLDVQLALAVNFYNRTNRGQDKPSCRLSEALDNIENFFYSDDFTGSRGWSQWINISGNPQQYTPYGAKLSAEGRFRARLVNERGEELSYLNFGDGFFSTSICEAVEGAGTTQEDCFLSTPGKFIQETLTFNTDSGRQSLVAADEIDEIIAALLGQLAQMALTGAGGLLGLTDNRFGEREGGAYTDQVREEIDDNLVTAGAINEEVIGEQIALENEYIATLEENIGRLEFFIANETTAALRQAAVEVISDFESEIIEAQNNIAEMESILARYVERDPEDYEELTDLTLEYYRLPLNEQRDIQNSLLRTDAATRFSPELEEFEDAPGGDAPGDAPGEVPGGAPAPGGGAPAGGGGGAAPGGGGAPAGGGGGGSPGAAPGGPGAPPVGV